ncbi:MAG: hypothetical protein ACJ768_01135 [Gaiellaceae bacterium]
MPPDTLTNAVRATEASGSYRFTLGGSIDVVGQGFPIEGGGAVNTRAGRARATLDLRQALAGSGISSISPAEAVADAVVIGRTLYVRSPYLAKRRGIRSTWIRYSVRGASLLDYLSAVRSVKLVGSDTIGGVRTTHYTAVVTLTRYPRPLTVDVWVDSARRIRRLVTQLVQPSFTAVPQIDVSGFGRPVVVTPPR